MVDDDCVVFYSSPSKFGGPLIYTLNLHYDVRYESDIEEHQKYKRKLCNVKTKTPNMIRKPFKIQGKQ